MTEHRNLSPQANPVLVLGASNKPNRYAFLAAQALLEQGYPIVLVSNKGDDILGHKALTQLPHLGIDTVTLYLSPENQQPHVTSLLKLQPRRVIFNPGTENPEFMAQLQAAQIDVVVGCTLVMLKTGQFA